PPRMTPFQEMQERMFMRKYYTVNQGSQKANAGPGSVEIGLVIKISRMRNVAFIYFYFFSEFLAASSKASIRRSFRISSAGAVVSSSFACSVGLFARIRSAVSKAPRANEKKRIAGSTLPL